MSHIQYVLKRLGKAILLIFAIATLNFLLIRIAPGDPASVMAGEAGAADELFVRQLRAEFRLDDPLPVQLGEYLLNIASFNLGYSYRNQRTVSDLLFERLPATLLLTGSAFIVALSIGVFLGAIAASRRGRWPDTLIGTVALMFYATPLFWFGLMFVLLFSVLLNWLPAFGMGSVQQLGGFNFVLDRGKHLILPVLTLASYYVAIYGRLTRASMLEVQQQDFVKLARAKGLPPGRIARMHVLRNALLPVITFAGIQAGHLIGGSILVETVFAWPGIGRLALESMLVRDYNTLLGVFLICAVMTIVFNLITDLLYMLADPRIEIQR